MRFCNIFRSIVLLLMSIMLLAGFTVVRQGYDKYREALEGMSLEEKVASIQAKEGYTRLEALGEEIGVKIHCQREEIFTKMHRI